MQVPIINERSRLGNNRESLQRSLATLRRWTVSAETLTKNAADRFENGVMLATQVNFGPWTPVSALADERGRILSKKQAFASQFDMLQHALKRVFPTTSDDRFADLLAALDAPTSSAKIKCRDATDRQEARFPLEIWGFYRTPNGGKRDILLKDISETGCRFFDKFSGLVPDQEISLKVEKLGPFVAVVRWNEAGYIGASFAQPIYGPIFDHIRLRLPGTS